METKKRKICIVTGNRAEYSRLKTVISELRKRPNIEVLLVATGSHLLDGFGNTLDEINQGGHLVDHKIFMELEGRNLCTMARAVGLGTCDLATYFENTKPDIIIAPMDRYEILSVAIPAALMNIPIAHMQGGEVSGTIDESVRHAITKLSHIHFPASAQSKDRIIKMGERPEMVFDVGDPATDVLLDAPQYDSESTIRELNKMILNEEQKLDPYKSFVLCMQHPVTTEFGSGFTQIQESLFALKKLSENPGNLNIVFLTPNIDAGGSHLSQGIKEFIEYNSIDNMAVLKHVPHDTFANLLINAKCMLGNSSSGIRESCYFGTPTVNIGTRQQDRERGKNVLDARHDREDIYNTVMRQIEHGKYEPEFIYGDGKSGARIAEILSTIDLNKIEIQKKITY